MYECTHADSQWPTGNDQVMQDGEARTPLEDRSSSKMMLYLNPQLRNGSIDPIMPRLPLWEKSHAMHFQTKSPDYKALFPML